MHVVHQILVVGVGMDGLDVAFFNAKLLVHHLQNRNNGVGGAGGCRKDFQLRSDHGFVHAHDHVGNAFSGCRQEHLGSTLGGQVAAQGGFVPKCAGVVNHQGVVDAVCGVVNFFRTACGNQVNGSSIHHQGLVFHVGLYGARKCTVHGVHAEQGGALFNRQRIAAAGNNGAQPQLLALAFLSQQLPSDQTANAAKSVQHHIHGLVCMVGFGKGGQFSCQETVALQVGGTFALPFYRQTTNVNAGRGEVHTAQSLGH